MPFEENVRLDSSQVQDVRNQSSGGRSGPSGPIMVGGGGLGLVVLVAALLLGVVNPTDLLSGSSSSPPVAGVSQSVADCQTGADANRRTDCQIVGYVNSIQDYWGQDFARRGQSYVPAKLVLFSGSIQAGCGIASEAQGPFYCPADKKVYLDLTFFDDLQQKLGAKGGSFAQGYVVAHEYGHHVQDLHGLLTGGSSGARGAQGTSVRTELQADCLAGVWANHAKDTGFLSAPTDAEIADALDAAASVGDDRIQRETTGRVTPETWTHGSAQQRQKWLRTGYTSGDLNSCDTSSGLL